jgi:hypothetical protein
MPAIHSTSAAQPTIKLSDPEDVVFSFPKGTRLCILPSVRMDAVYSIYGHHRVTDKDELITKEAYYSSAFQGYCVNFEKRPGTYYADFFGLHTTTAAKPASGTPPS